MYRNIHPILVASFSTSPSSSSGAGMYFLVGVGVGGGVGVDGTRAGVGATDAVAFVVFVAVVFANAIVI